jgi:hypothetical protein
MEKLAQDLTVRFRQEGASCESASQVRRMSSRACNP